MNVKISSPYITKFKKISNTQNENYKELVNNFKGEMVRENNVSYDGDIVTKINNVYGKFMTKIN